MWKYFEWGGSGGEDKERFGREDRWGDEKGEDIVRGSREEEVEEE